MENALQEKVPKKAIEILKGESNTKIQLISTIIVVV
jgi:hypothetical protein